MEKIFRSKCAITSALDIIWDKWTILIIRDMVAKHKKTFTELSESDEKIATNILSCRLKLLEKYKIITKEKSPENKKTNIYKLTDKGLGFTAILLELTFWSIDHIKEFQPNMAVSKAEEFRKDKAWSIKCIIESYKKSVLE